MHKRTSFAVLLVLLSIGCQVATDPPTPTLRPVQGTITLDPDDVKQTMEGFGASGAWWAQDVGGWENEARDRIVSRLFDRETGIGLSIYRYNIGGGDNRFIMDEWRRAETFEVSEGVYDWSRDANAIWMLRAAQEAGVEHFVAFVNSPPARMTVSGRTNHDFSNDIASNLRPEMYAQFAQYVVDVVRHLQEDVGVPIGWVSPINEPQWDWQIKSGQEGSHYTPAQVAAVTRAVVDALEASQLDVRLSVFEGGEWGKSSAEYVQPLLNDSKIAPHIDHLAIHSYWSTPEDKAQFVQQMNERYPDIAIEMTEWTEMKSGRDVSIASALPMANVILDDLTIGGVTSWQYWIAVSKYDFRDGLMYVDVESREMTETKRLWALGNFSRFVRPESQRVAASSDHEKVKTTAFLSPDQSQLIVVAVNNAPSQLTIGLDGIPAEFERVAVYETSAEHDLTETYTGDAPADIALAAESITTLVYSRE